MRYAYIFALVIYFPVHDLLSALLYGGGAIPQIGILRYLRDFSVISIAGIAILKTRLPHGIRWPIWAYIFLVCFYSLIGLARNIPPPVVISTAGTLAIPVLLFFVGYFCISDDRQFFTIGKVFMIIGCATALFGIYDVQNTDFWTNTINFNLYQSDIKGTESGLHPVTGLPWNFHGGVFGSRRAAGLLASPLAQGHFLAVAAALALMFYTCRRKASYLFIFGLLMFGLWQSGTRGAMLILLIAFAGMGFTNNSVIREPVLRWIATVLVLGLALIALEPVITMTIGLADGSSPGHWRALIANLQGLPSVFFFGHGVGFQGSIAARVLDLRYLLEGGGEGAIFSLTYQMGVPCAVSFLLFYFGCWKRLSISKTTNSSQKNINTMMKWLMIGFTTSFVTSETILTFSGSAALWLLLGGAIRLSMLAADPFFAKGTERITNFQKNSLFKT